MRALLSFLLLCTLMLTGCNQQVYVEIDWVDFIKCNGKLYHGSFLYVLDDPSDLRKEIGEVNYNVAKNVHDPAYKTKDGDAAFREPGTKLYAIEGYPQQEVIAVPHPKLPGGYQIYEAEPPRSPEDRLFRHLPRAQVTKVSVHLNSAVQKELTGEAIQELFTLLDEATPYNFTQYDGAIQYTLVFHTGTPLAASYGLVAAKDGTFVFSDDVHMKVSNRIAQLLGP